MSKEQKKKNEFFIFTTTINNFPVSQPFSGPNSPLKKHKTVIGREFAISKKKETAKDGKREPSPSLGGEKHQIYFTKEAGSTVSLRPASKKPHRSSKLTQAKSSLHEEPVTGKIKKKHISSRVSDLLVETSVGSRGANQFSKDQRVVSKSPSRAKIAAASHGEYRSIYSPLDSYTARAPLSRETSVQMLSSPRSATSLAKRSDHLTLTECKRSDDSNKIKVL